MKKVLLPISLVCLSFGLNAQTYFSEDFTGGLGQFTATDSDGDTYNWTAYDYNDGQGNVATSESWVGGGVGPLTPDNWLISSAIDLTGASGSISLSWLVKGQDQAWADENYTVYVATAGDIATLSASGTTFNEIVGATNDAYVSRSLDVSSFAGSTIYVGFRHHNVTDQFRLNIDNVLVKTVVPDDAALDAVVLARYAATSSNTQLSVDVTNAGSNAITSLTIDWNDGTAHSQTITTNIAPGATATVDHPDFVTYATATEANINVSITNVNGNTDGDPSNNDGSALHNTVSQLVEKFVVIEEGTGTWCGWCPRGAVAMDYMAATYNDFIGVAVHNNDPMTVTEYDNGAAISGFPGANVDRALLGVSVSQALFEQYYNDRTNMIVPALISATPSVSGNDVTIDATATFYTPFASANYRLGVIMVENGVTGTDAGYNQANYYAGGGQGAMGGYESLPDPVPAAQMVYDHVGRALLGGYAGQAGSVPGTITDGQAVNYSFNYTVPGTSTVANMHAVVVLIDESNGEIVNAVEINVDPASAGIETNPASINMTVFPNPATDNVTVSFEAEGNYAVSVTDMQGRQVFASNYNDLFGAQSINIPTDKLMNGSYIVTVSTEGASFNQVLVIRK